MTRIRSGTIAALAFMLAAAPGAARAPAPAPIVGVWLVTHPTAPFPLHLYVFNADHTMQQANPDGGDPHGSDSDGKGVWKAQGKHVVGKWVEIFADRATHKLTGHGELTFDASVSGDTLTGTGTFLVYDPTGNRAGDPIDAPFTGTRVKAP